MNCGRDGLGNCIAPAHFPSLLGTRLSIPISAWMRIEEPRGRNDPEVVTLEKKWCEADGEGGRERIINGVEAHGNL